VWSDMVTHTQYNNYPALQKSSS